MLRNPFEILSELYHYLRLEPRSNASPVEQIWEDDQKLLQEGLEFYQNLKQRIGASEINWLELQTLLDSENVQSHETKSVEHLNSAKLELESNPDFLKRIEASHRGFQIGLDLLRLPVAIGEEAGFYEMRGTADLEVEIPDKFNDPETFEQLISELVPSPPTQGDEIIAWSGGTFYSRETPESESYVNTGSRVKTGDVVGLLEVMKMFNPVRAECDGTIREICLDGSLGVNVSRGQTLFRLDPDHPLQKETKQEREEKEREVTLRLMNWNEVS